MKNECSHSINPERASTVFDSMESKVDTIPGDSITGQLQTSGVTPRLRALGRMMQPGRPRRPVYLLLFVTNRCHARCAHCFYWRETNQAVQTLSLEEIDRLCSSLGPMVQMTLTGGSPELRDDLPQIVNVVRKRCNPLNLTICYTGDLPEVIEAQVRESLESNPGLKLTVNISLDGLGSDHDTYRRRKGLFDRAVESVRRLTRVREDHPNLCVGCGICVHGLNSAGAVDTARWAMENLSLDNLSPVLVRGDTHDPNAQNGDVDAFLEIADLTRRRLQTGEFRGYSAALHRFINAKDIVQKELIAEIARNGSMPVACSALHDTAVVYADGSAPVCEMRDEIIGNVRDYGMDLAALWKLPETGETRRGILRGECSCWHHCFLSTPIVREPKLWARLMKHALLPAPKRNPC
jgi:Fe-coproporphyrin III synthase